jgi:hypothetical protein
MPQAIQLVDPALGAIVSISQDDWTTINQQVAIVLAFRRGWDDLDAAISGSRALTADCALWRCGTFPLITRYPAGLIGYADLASQLLGSLQAPIGKLNPNDPLPAALAAFAQDVFGILSQGATALSNVANAAAALIARFSGDNAVVDAGIAHRMGSAPVQGSVNNVDQAAGLVVGAWQAMSTDLSNVMSGELPITTALLLSLDIGTALSSWASVRSDAEAFAAFAPTQQHLLDAGWQGGIVAAGQPG